MDGFRGFSVAGVGTGNTLGVRDSSRPPQPSRAGFGADVAPAAPTEYRDIPYVGSRNVIWVVAQLHLLLAGFVLGVPMFAWVCEVVA